MFRLFQWWLKLILILVVSFHITSHAQLVGTNISPGDSCTGKPNGAQTINADGSGSGRMMVLVCNGTIWQTARPHFVNPGACVNNIPVTFDAATGGFRCGPVDTISPIWVTASGTIATSDINLLVSTIVAASDESGSPTYSKVSGAGWLNVAANGTVSGMAPSSAGNYAVTVRATDGSGNTVDRTFNVVVNNGNGPVDCPNPGNICADGSVYAGLTPDTNVHFFVRQQKLPGNYSYKEDTSNDNGFDTPVVNCSTSQTGCITGEYNTNTLIASDAETLVGNQRHMAALACYCLGEQHANAPDGVVPAECSSDPAATNTLEGYGKDDWYLPAIYELQVIFKNLVAPGDPDTPLWPIFNSGGWQSAANDGPLAGALSSGTWHYSSSEVGANHVVTMGFTTGVVYSGNGGNERKRDLRPVICARK